MNLLHRHLPSMFFGLFLPSIISSFSATAATGTWNSKVTQSNISYTTTESPNPLKDANGKNMTVVYLEDLAVEKIGQNSNAEDVEWLLSQGYRVIELNYDRHSKATAPDINQDIIAINDALNSGSFCGMSNCSAYRSYVLFEGYRLARDVSYFKDDPSVYNWPGGDYTDGDSLYMDIAYPANASQKVPVVISFSYSNSHAKTPHQRLFLGYTLAMFDDSFLEGAPANGIAWAIADHPKYCDWGNGKPTGGDNKDYGSFETNPDAIQKVKSAIRTLRAVGENLNLSGKIGVYGFSRGSTVGSLAVGDRTVTEFEKAGRFIGVSDDIQAAALGSGVFDYTHIYEASNDGDSQLETRCPKVWGDLSSNREKWESMGAVYMVQSFAAAPVLFFYNTSDEKYYQSQIAHFKQTLEDFSVPTETLINYGSGHAVPQKSADLEKMYDFFKRYLIVKDELPKTSKNNSISLFACPNDHELQVNFKVNNVGNVQIMIFDMSGNMIYRVEKKYAHAGLQREILGLSNIPGGVYQVKVIADGETSNHKFIISI